MKTAMFRTIGSVAWPRCNDSRAGGGIVLTAENSGTGRHARITVDRSVPGARRRRAQRVLAIVATLLLAGCVHLPHPEIPRMAEDVPGLAVFDIDGTLTPRVSGIFSTRPDAAAVARFYADRGYRIVYLTARTRALQGNLRSYLYRRGFPAGDLVVPQTRADEAAHDAFKADVLESYKARGWTVAAAYGDSTTDFVAYARAGVPRARVFALQRVGAAACQPGIWAACLPGWSSHLRALRSGEESTGAPAGVNGAP